MTKILFRTPFTIKVMITIFLFFGAFCMFRCTVVGILFYFSALFLLFKMQELSIRLHDLFEYDIMRWQIALFCLLIFIVINIGIYKYQAVSSDNVTWNPLNYSYGSYNSKDLNCNGWFSGKTENNSYLDSGTGALGFWFCDPEIPDLSDPILLKPELAQSFNLTYSLKKNMLVEFMFEGYGDINLTHPKAEILFASDEKTIRLNLGDFEWLSNDKIKHLKMNYTQITWYDAILIRLLLFLDLERFVRYYYFVVS